MNNGSKQIVIFGLADTAQLAHYYFTHDSPHQVVAFTVDKPYMHHEQYCGLPVVPFETVLNHYPPSDYAMFIAIGYPELNLVRTQKYQAAKSMGYEIVSYVSSKASTWSGLAIGENCFILENNLIQPFVKIGNNVTIWSGNNIGHHSELRDHCYITSHVVLSGRVIVGESSFIGVNASVGDYVHIGSRCIVAASALILNDTHDDSIYTGRPAKAKQISHDLVKKIFKVQRRNTWDIQ